MLKLLQEPWPWYTSGIVIAGIMVMLLFFGKTFGFSSNLSTICSMAGAGKKVSLFDFDWRTQKWNLLFLLGAIAGGFISNTWLNNNEPLKLAGTTIADLKAIGIQFDGQLEPGQLFDLQYLSLKNIILMLFGGLMIGFGSRYAGGCTSGHAISGLSNLQIPSLVAVIGFFAGGLIMTHFLFPLIF